MTATSDIWLSGSAELRLLTACLIWPDSAVRRARIAEAAAATQSWDRLVRLAERHRVLGLVHHGVTSAGLTLPPETARYLAMRAQSVGLDELRMAGEAVRLVRLVESAGIKVRVLKGAAVAMLAFGRLGLRFNHDIDILVAPADVARTAEILGAAGYRRTEPAADVPEAQLRRWLRDRKDMAYRHETSGTLVELHWRLFDNPHLLPQLGKTGAQHVDLSAGQSFDTLSDEDLPIYLCMHGAQHAWARLKWLADFGAWLSARPPAAIDAFYARSRSMGAHRATAPALSLCHELFDTYLPPEAANAMQSSSRMRWLYNVAERCLFGDGEGTELEDEKFGTTRKNISHYFLATGLRYRLTEARFDLTDDRDRPITGAWRALGPFARPVMWLWRRIFGGGSNDPRAKPTAAN